MLDGFHSKGSGVLWPLCWAASTIVEGLDSAQLIDYHDRYLFLYLHSVSKCWPLLAQLVTSLSLCADVDVSPEVSIDIAYEPRGERFSSFQKDVRVSESVLWRLLRFVRFLPTQTVS
jgi:hypothetical protein